MTHGVYELLRLRILMKESGFLIIVLMRLYCNNKVAISISHNSTHHDRTKHIKVDRHFNKEILNSRDISTPYVKSSDQHADVLTKGISSSHLPSILSKLGMSNRQ